MIYLLLLLKAPQDEEIVKLGKELNSTYIAYGNAGAKKKARQNRQDGFAASMSKESLVQRSVAKASKQYVNTGWDLADAVENESVELDKIKDDDLPSEMKGMNKKEKEEYINKKTKKRERIQKRINQLNKERRQYVTEEMKKRSEKNTLDQAIIKTVREQALSKNYRFE